MKYLLLNIKSMLVLALLSPIIVHAQTPDGMTPAEEVVCSEYSGAAFGLCNAYCEAMDCDYIEPQAAEQACDRVRANFSKITGEDLLPCDAVCGLEDGICPDSGCEGEPDPDCDVEPPVCGEDDGICPLGCFEDDDCPL